jgi:transposase-like protein
MDSNALSEVGGRRRRRLHSAEFKAELVAHCQQRGISVAAVAKDHGLNPNLLRRWIQEYERFGQHACEPDLAPRRDVPASFIPVQIPAARMPTAPAPQSAANICIDLQREGFHVSVRWPVDSAQQCAMWLRELMR